VSQASKQHLVIPCQAVTGIEIGAAAAKIGAPVGVAAYRRLYPDDWGRRLAKIAASEVSFRVPKRRVRKWLKAPEATALVDAFVGSGADAASDDAASSLDAMLCHKRRWRRLPESDRRDRARRLIRAVVAGLIKAQDPSYAVDLASRRQSAEMRELRRDLTEDRAAGSRTDFEAALATLPAAARDTVTALSDSSTSGVVQRIALTLGREDAQPTALVPLWLTDPPSWLGDDPDGWAALGVLAEEYLLLDQPVESWTRAADHGAPMRDHWLMRAAWLLFEQQARPDDDATALERARQLLDRIGAANNGEALPLQALRAFLDGRDAEASRLLMSWDASDVAGRAWRTRMLFVATVTAISNGTATWADAAKVLEDSYNVDPLPRTGLLLSRALTYSVYAKPTANRVEMLIAAYDIAIQVRNELRATRAPSTPAIKAAVEAADMANDQRRILRVATDWPEHEGEATDGERKFVGVAQAVVTAALLFGLAARAHEYAEALPDGYERSLCLAMCDDLSDTLSAEQRRAMWSDVLALARNVSERLPAWEGLARAGATELPRMSDEIGQTQPAVAAALEASATAARGLHDDAVRMLLPFARKDMTAARQLAKIYNDHGDEVDAARTLLDAGVDFHNPDLVMHAAEIFLENQENTAAKDAIERALADHGPEWQGRATALRIAANVDVATNRIDAACDKLAAALRLDPESVNGRWALVELLCQRGLSRQAWQTISDAPDELPVRTVNEARAWLDACLHGGPGGERFVVGGLRLIDQFRTEERLAAAVLMHAFGIEMSPQVVEDFQRELAWFLQTWPDSQALRTESFPSDDDPDAVRAVLDSMPGPSDEQRKFVLQLADQVQAGRMPLALLAAAVRTTYTEALINRIAGPLVAMSPHANDNELGRAAASGALDHDVVADLAALHIVAELIDDQPDIAAIIDIAHRGVAVAESIAHDITRGAAALARPIVGTWIPPRDGNRSYFSPVADSERERVRRCIAQLQERLATHRTVPDAAAVTVFGEREYDNDLAAWDRSIQSAYDRKQALWSDDLVTRVLARDAGVPAFSTLDLLTALAQRKQITDEQVQRAIRCLVDRGIADVPLSAQTLRDLSSLNGWAPGHAGAALARPEAWANPDATIQTWIDFVRSMPTTAHNMLPAWTHAATLGAVRVPYMLGPPAARMIAARILSTVVLLAAMTPRIVADSLEAASAAIKVSGVTLDDPVPIVVRLLRDALIKRVPPEQVAPYVLAAFSACPDSVQSTARRSLLIDL
jgi:tetratricopeptide (TPR) repeat protein